MEAERFISEHKTLDEFQSHCMREAFQQARPLQTPDRETTPHPGFRDAGGNLSTSEPGSIGERIVSRSDYQEFAKNSGRGKMFKVEFPEVVGTRALTVSGAGLTSFDRQGVVALGVPNLLVADLLMQAQTSMPTVRFIREDSFTNAATAVSEAGIKPSADLDLSEIDSPVRKIAVVSKVSDELIQDFAQVETFLNGRLGYMVSAVLDAQIVNGDGIAPNLLGLRNTAGIQTQAKATDTALDAIFLAISRVNSVGFFKADGIIMHPNDWAALRLTKDSNNQYFGSGPFYAPYGNQLVPIQVPTVWQLPVAVTTAIAQGTALVGAFKQCATIFWRKGLFVDMTNSNEDDFKKNLVSVRAELRAAVICQSPLGLCQITGLPA